MGLLYFMQTSLIFPGKDSQGRASATVVPPAHAELASVTTVDGDRTVALFGPALSKEGTPLADASSRPTILFFYGNGDSLRATSRYLFDEFRRLGANVCIPEYVGYGMSTGEAGEQACYATADAAYDYLLGRSDVDPSKIVAAGWSLGAAVAVDLASRRPVAGLAMFSAFTSMSDMAREVYPFLPGITLVLKHRFENLAKIARVSCPIVVGHGTSDRTIPSAMSERLVAAATSPVSYLPIEGAAHNDFFGVGGPAVYGALRGLVERAGHATGAPG
jgi:pimeloyl-ACP methyl ester carboxylesterase